MSSPNSECIVMYKLKQYDPALSKCGLLVLCMSFLKMATIVKKKYFVKLIMYLFYFKVIYEYGYNMRGLTMFGK